MIESQYNVCGMTGASTFPVYHYVIFNSCRHYAFFVCQDDRYRRCLRTVKEGR